MAEMKRTRVDDEILRFGEPKQLQDLALEMAEELIELRRRAVSVSISQSDIDTLAEVRDLLDSMVEDAGAEGRNSDFSEYLGMREVMSRIITALRSR